MNSGHPQYEQQPLVNFLELCKRRFPSAIVTGNARWAVCSFCAGKPQTVTAHVNSVTLVEEKDVAEALCKGPCGRKYCCYVHELNDLAPAPFICRTIGDPYDVDEARRERREARKRQQAEQQRA